MRSRLAQPAKSAFWAFFTLAACAAPLMAADTRISFQVATGSSAGTYFPVGEAIAGLVSHPPGIGRCEAPGVCGPIGLIASARTSQGSFDNLAQVESGAVDSGLAQSDIVAAAIKGEGIFKKDGPRRHVRVIASLFEEDVHLVASTRSRIKSVSDLRGKRVALGLASSGIGFTAREIFAAWGVAEKSVRLSNQDTQTEVAAMKAGTLDAFFMVGGVPESALGELLSSGTARLVALDGKNRDKLVKAVPSLLPATIPAGAYPNIGAVETISTRAVWIVRDSASETLVHDMTRALFNPANRDQLSLSHPSAREISLAAASRNPPAPLHPGAARYYKEMAGQALR